MLQATETAQLQHKVREPANAVDIVPGLQHNSLLSINKFAEANYVTVFMPDEVNIFHGKQASITSTHQPIIQGWRDPATGLWRIQIKPAPTSTPKYEPAQTEHDKHQNQQITINNMYKLPSTKQIIRYYHTIAGFPTKATLIKQ